MKQSTTKFVLLVDDEPDLIVVLIKSLRALGDNYTFHTASDGSDALEKIRQHTYDLVITDYMMPVMDGVTLAQHIRKLSPDTQIIMMTAYSSSKLPEALRSLKLDGYIDKPIKIKQIREIVKKAVGNIYERERSFCADENRLDKGSCRPIDDLKVHANARAVLLLSASGYTLGSAGQIHEPDIAGIGALVAANFMAATELAKLLGNNSIFKSSYHEGPNYNIYAHGINEDYLLAVIFGSESKTGMVRYYATKAVDELKPLLEQTQEQKLPPEMAAHMRKELQYLFA
ncbi:MAG: response regulator [Ardenticatenaceae bacterium]|nr:response regulator [Anaerolineales bacterium]MCB8922292.1 response regulator [Ardenticatenaceae bacterium]MCB8990523.1 response regulator [Ardenticatenaceae bacterium]MCB9005671.1 response regulator [Ardenticatenaceae bacterium]